jgi:ankyrin repeat protein
MSSQFLLTLATAMERCDRKKVRSLFASGQIQIDFDARVVREHDDSQDIFQLAARLLPRDHDILEMILNAGANINGVDAQGQTACHSAVWLGDVKLLKFLHAHGADLGIADGHGRTPLDTAVFESDQRNAKFIETLVVLGAPIDPDDKLLACALAVVSTTCIQSLLDRGIAVSELRDQDGATPLHNALVDPPLNSSDSDAMLRMLINVCGIDIDARDCLGATSCLRAAAFRQVVKLRWLIEAGADIELAENGGSTPLQKAGWQLPILNLLLAAGANVYARDEDGETACHLAVTHRDRQHAVSLVNALLASGDANDILDEANLQGVTPRQLLAQRQLVVGDTEAVELARRDIARTRLDLVRRRALQVCIGLASLRLSALQTCEILVHACGRMATLVPFHQWWTLATAVKHFRARKRDQSRQ